MKKIFIKIIRSKFIRLIAKLEREKERKEIRRRKREKE